MSNKHIPAAQAAFQWSASGQGRKSRDRYAAGAFVLATILAFSLATPAPARAAIADILSGFLSGPAEAWHGETVAATIGSAQLRHPGSVSPAR